jgi:pSer/pThr/pTyr-binding forkhead associated (FHA) protein
MVQLKILSGKTAGQTYLARRFPLRIGRSPASDIRFEEDGVWEQHLELTFRPGEGFLLKAHPDALAVVNGEAIQQTALRNGDTIEIGSLKMQFWLSETRQPGLRFRESLVWAGIVLVCLFQIAAIYWLLQ